LTDTLIDLNYAADCLEDVLDWDDGFTEADIEQRLVHFRETEVFKQLADMNRPMLSSDPAEFRRLANMNRIFAERAAARPNIELPRLREFAAEIQALIEEEYR